MTTKRESNLFITSMITDRIGRLEILLPINHNHFNFRKNKYTRQCLSLKIPPFWKLPSFSLDKWLLLLLLSGLSMIGCFHALSDNRYPITANCPITLSNYNCTEWLVIYKAADVPITCEEIVMVMTNQVKIQELSPIFSLTDCRLKLHLEDKCCTCAVMYILSNT